MSTTAGISNLTGASYAAKLAQTSKLERALYSLGAAIQNGNLGAAGTSLKSLINDYPRYSNQPNESSASNPINQDFQAISNALDKNDVEAARIAWSQLKSDLVEMGIKEITDGKAATTKLLADNKASINEAVLSNLFGGSSDASITVSALLNGSSTSSSPTDAINAAISSWITYNSGGAAQTSLPAAPASVAGIETLDTQA